MRSHGTRTTSKGHNEYYTQDAGTQAVRNIRTVRHRTVASLSFAADVVLALSTTGSSTPMYAY
jgi:hypothetical protein